jgi:hypothetical protein
MHDKRLEKVNLEDSVADPGCLSRIPDSQIPDPDFYPSRILDPGSRLQKPQEKRGVKKICCHIFFVVINFTRLKNILFLKWQRKKFGPVFKEL